MADSYLSQARAGDWRVVTHRRLCIECREDHTGLSCPARIAIFTLERVKEEIERLAKERCSGCRTHLLSERFADGGYAHRGAFGSYCNCDAQLEQRRLAELNSELDTLKPAGL